MTTFFKKIQGYFSAEYHGRYLGLILKEVCELHPEILCEFIYDRLKIQPSERFTKPSFQAEYPYMRSEQATAGKTSKNRIADFVILDHGIPKVLIEIKFHDQEIFDHSTEESQFKDYVAWTKAEPGRHSIVISLNPLDTKGMAHAYWSDFAQHLSKDESKSELIYLLRQYLQQEKVALQDIDKTVLLEFLVQEVPKARNALIAKRENVQLTSTGDEFEIFQNNLRILSKPCVKLIKGINPTKRWQGIDHEVTSSSPDGPLDVIRVFSQHVLTGEPGFWCLRYGIELWEIGSEKMQCHLYSCVWDWRGTHDITEYTEIAFENLTNLVFQKSSQTILDLHKLIGRNLINARDKLNLQQPTDTGDRTNIVAVLEKLSAQFV